MLHFYMQIKPESIYMEEDGTSNVEFPVAGQFHLASTSRFKVCGDPATSGSVEERRSPFLTTTISRWPSAVNRANGMPLKVAKNW